MPPSVTVPAWASRAGGWLASTLGQADRPGSAAIEQQQMLDYEEEEYGVSEEELERLGFEPLSISDRQYTTKNLGYRDLLWRLSCVISIGWTIGLYTTYPTPSSVPVFIGAALIITSWTILAWSGLVWSLLRRKESVRSIVSAYRIPHWIVFALATALVSFWVCLSVTPAKRADPPVMRGNGDKYFIAVNLHNNEAILAAFITQLTSLIFHLGKHEVFVSIYESNSKDGTVTFLKGLNHSLTDLGIEHRIITNPNDPGSSWPYGTSPERMEFLARARNKALEPIQSADSGIRLPDWQEFTKIVFLNDILFNWQDIVELIGTRIEGQEEEEYDLACAMDFGSAGLYDTWVARDVCGTPLRAFWPFVKDRTSQDAIRRETPFAVSACWNGAVVLRAQPFLYQSEDATSSTRRLVKRGWKMIDDQATYPGSRISPPLTTPIRFRTSGIEACDHSECFLLSYDLHRYHNSTTGRPRILMNPKVQVAYEQTWFKWNTVILRQPVIQWWRRVWSHGIGYKLFDWPFEALGRRRDYCTWAGLMIPTNNERCPGLPGAKDRPWNQ